MGWSGKKNGELLRLMSGIFDVLLTLDQYIVLNIPNNRVESILPLMAKVSERLETIHPGELIHIPELIED